MKNPRMLSKVPYETVPSLEWGFFPREVKRPGREADHSPQCNVDVKNAWSFTSAHLARLHGVVRS